jgi:uncharacterized protein
MKHNSFSFFDFEEFLMAYNNKSALKQYLQIPFSEAAFQVLMDIFHTYLIIGGMPEIVRGYIQAGSMANLRDLYEGLIQGYKDDVEKYASNKTERRVIRHIIDNAHLEKDRFSFEGFANSNYRSREVAEAMKMLDMSRVLQLIYPSTSTEPPIVNDFKKRPRLQFLDTGLFNYMLNKQAEMLLINDFNEFHRGKVILHMITQEIKAQFDSPSYAPNFWVREKTNSSAEVDIIVQFGKYIIPVEVKSGAYGKLKSLQLFMDQCNHPFAVRFLANKFSIEQLKTPKGKSFYLMNLPYFLGGRLFQYLEWFVKNHEEGKSFVVKPT